MMHIVPISGMNTLGTVGGGPQINGGKSAGTSFTDLFKEAVRNVEELDDIKKQDALNLALGEVDDLGQLQTNAEKAQVAVQLLVQMRNKVLDSYSEIMRMNV